MEQAIDKVLTQHNIRPVLEKSMLPDLRLSVKELLKEIIVNKELDRHWLTKERENARLHRATRRAEIDRKRLEMGSEYETDEEEKRIIAELQDSEEESDSYYDDEDYDNEAASEDQLADLSEASPRAGCSGLAAELASPYLASPSSPSKSAMGNINGGFGKNMINSGEEPQPLGRHNGSSSNANGGTRSKARSLRSRHSMTGT